MVPTSFVSVVFSKSDRLLAKSKGRNPKIAAYWINCRVVRFHPRAILAKMAKDNGASMDLISAMFNPPNPN
jgi:hypothetical protein